MSNWVTTYLFLCTHTLLIVNTDSLSETSPNFEMEYIPDLVFNETISPLGKDFFDYYMKGWQNPTNKNDLVIHVSEKPVPGLGTRVYVLVNDRMIYQGFLKPRQELIENAAQNALKVTYYHFINIEQIEKQLETKDQQGSGIF